MTIYNISIITSTGFPYCHKIIKNLPSKIKLYQRFFDFTEDFDRDVELLDQSSSFELNAGLVSALFEFAKCLDKRISILEFKSLNHDSSKNNTNKVVKYTGDALITLQTETYLLHKSVKEKIKLIYNLIISPKIPLESANIIEHEEEEKIMDILTDSVSRDRVFKNQTKIKDLSKEFFQEMGQYGLFNIVITSFDLSPIIVLGEKYSFKDIEVILRNIGELPNIEPYEWKYRQSFFKEDIIWVYLINSGVGVSVEGLFQPYFYLLFTDSQSYLGEFPGKLTTMFNMVLG